MHGKRSTSKKLSGIDNAAPRSYVKKSRRRRVQTVGASAHPCDCSNQGGKRGVEKREAIKQLDWQKMQFEFLFLYSKDKQKT